MQHATPVFVLELIPEERQRLLALLDGLSDSDWTADTACPGWTVEDIALHVLGADVGLLSRLRDAHRLEPAPGEDVVTFVNRLNDNWLRATRRVSPRLLCELLEWTGERVHDYLSTLDPEGLGEQVSWAGSGAAPNWLVIAREYTERWVHQEQIREAVGTRGLLQRRFFPPVLATFVRALPHTFRDVLAPVGTSVALTIEGEAGGRWAVVRSDHHGRWELYEEPKLGSAAAVVRMAQDTAWRMFTKAIDPTRLRRKAQIRGDRALGEVVLRSVAIIG